MRCAICNRTLFAGIFPVKADSSRMRGVFAHLRLHIAQSVLKYLHRYSERNLSAGEIYVAEIRRDSGGTSCRRPKSNKRP